MRLSYTEIFKYSDILNPISSKTLFLAGKLAELHPQKNVLDLGSGKGFPSLLWAGVFGVNVEGFELNRSYVEYANSRAKLLNLSNRVRYVCGDVRKLRFTKVYDVVSSLGLGVAEVYGAIDAALKEFKRMMPNYGFLILAEPVWLVKPVPHHVQKRLGTPEKNFSTKPEMERLFNDFDFEVVGSYVSSKEDWECYIRPVNVAMQELMEINPDLAAECQEVIEGFEAEYRAVKKYWDMVLWVARTH